MDEKYSAPETVGEMGKEREREVEDFRVASHEWPFRSRAESASTLAVRIRSESPSSSFCGGAEGRANWGEEELGRLTEANGR